MATPVKKLKKVEYKIPFLKPTPENSILNGNKNVWFLTAGSVPSIISTWEKRNKNWEDKYEWRDNTVFKANLRFVTITWGGKALFENTETGARFYMNQTALDKLLSKSTIVFGIVLASWKFKKHGSSYSIVPVY
ncbi:MAG: hypothetical protein WC761_00780 [Candidatus Paceibacterota bacterium]|jgi:hypothetical protein